MNIALIIAGGSGQRMQSEIPKQFINVYDKPVLIYTLEAFQKHPEIDAIGLVCIDGWHETVWAMQGSTTSQSSSTSFPAAKPGRNPFATASWSWQSTMGKRI